MFYQTEFSPALRLGDIVRGFILANPDVKAPFVTTLPVSYLVKVNQPAFTVVLSPCCSISDKVLSLVPLQQLRSTFFRNSYLLEDITRINRKMTPEQAVPPETWNNLPDKEKQKRQAQGYSYAFAEIFVYASHDLLPSYVLPTKDGEQKTNIYMIDFRNVSIVNCDKVVNPKQVPLEAKWLELSIESRSQLREKIAAYFARIPEEDLVATA